MTPAITVIPPVRTSPYDVRVSDSLVDAFSSAWPGTVADRAALARALAGAVADAHAAWHDVERAPTELARQVGERIPADADPVAGVASLCVGDLWLAVACTRGDPFALRAFDAVCVDAVTAAGRRLRASDSDIDELAQVVRHHLLVPRDGHPARLSQYGGRGRLGRWIRATAARLHLNALRARKAAPAVGDAPVLDGIASPGVDPELAHLKARYRRTVAVAFGEAMASLSARDRNLLRYFYIDGLRLDQLAALHKTSRATAHRWLVRAREAAAAATEAALRSTIDASAGELASIRRLVMSDLGVSLRALLVDSRDGA